MEHILPQGQIEEIRAQNQQLKAKYKKSLQELMHVLQINKSLKESINNSSSHDHSQRSEMSSINKKNNDQIQNYIGQIESLALKELNYQDRIRELQEKHKEKEREIVKIQKDLKDAINRISGLQAEKTKRQEQQYKSSHIHQEIQRQLSSLKQQNLELKNQNIKHLKTLRNNEQLQKQKYQLKDEIVELKQHIKNMTSQMYEDRRRHRNQVAQLQNHYLEQRKEDAQKIKNIEYKFMSVESELHNYKNVESFLQNESRSMRDEEELFNSIRDQIQKINGDWYRLDNQKAIEIEELKDKDRTNCQKISELQALQSKNKQLIKQYEQKIKALEKQIKQNGALQEKVKVSESHRKELLQKNYVLQALNITQRHRAGQDVSERIGQFQRRVNILLDQKVSEGLEGANSLQQIVILKGYIRELSDILGQYKKREQKLLHSRSSLKAKHRQIEEGYKIRLEAAKLKIAHYNNLVEKLYRFSEEKVRQRHVFEDRDLLLAIDGYEDKLQQMCQDILKLQKKISDLENINQDLQQQLNQAHNNTPHPPPPQKKVSFKPEEGFADEREEMKGLINKLQFTKSGLQAQNNNLIAENNHLQKTLQAMENNLAEREEVIISKDKIISGLTDEVSKLESNNYRRNTKEENLMEVLNNYENKVAQLEAELENKIRINNILNSKINSFNTNQEALSPLKQSSNYESQRSSQYLRDNIKDLQKTIYSQNEQIYNYKNIISRLEQELDTLRTQSQKTMQNQGDQDYQDIIRRYEEQLRSVQNEKNNLEEAVIQLRNQVEQLDEANHECNIQLSRKQTMIKKQRDEITRLQIIEEREADIVRSTKDIMTQFEDINTSTLNKNSKEIDKLNATILTLHTNILTLQNQIKDKQAIISELKHQNYNLELTKKRYSNPQNNQNAVSNNGGQSNLKEAQQQQQIQNLMKLLVQTGAQIESLRMQNQSLIQKFGADIAKEEEAINKIQTVNAKLDEAMINNTSIENKLKKQEIGFDSDSFKVATSYESVPSEIYSNVVSIPSEFKQFKPKRPIEESVQKQQSSSNLDKQSSQAGSKRSIKMIKMAARPSIEIASPLRTTVKNPP